MTFLIAMLLTCLLLVIGRDFIKKHSTISYLIALAFSLILIVGGLTGFLYRLPAWFTKWLLPVFTKSSFSTALFVIVMYTGALKNGSRLIKYLMPVRAELSIIASILTLSHNIVFGKRHFVQLFTAPSTMAPNVLIAAIVSLILISLMLILMVTSFPQIRRKMHPKSWKQLQKTAYVFYALIYVHVMLLMTPLAISGNGHYLFNVVIYSVVFITYAILRIRKAYHKKTRAVIK